MSMGIDSGADRRTVLKGAAASAALLATSGRLFAADDFADVKKAIASAHAKNVKRLKNWIAFPSIAAEGRNTKEGAEYMRKLVFDAGFQRADVVPTSGAPGVFATLDAGAPKTLGVYFMLDVKQYDPKEWSSPPLEGRIVEKPGFGKVMYGRGATNQKGPEATVLAALHAMRAAGRKPPINLVLVAEGEEEIGSTHFREIVNKPEVLSALKKCVGVVMPSNGQGPTGSVEIGLGAKGIVELQLIASGEKWGRGPAKDIHSSLKATVDSPVWRLVHALDTLVSKDGNTVAIEGWYEHVRPLTARQKELIAANARATPEAERMKAFGIKNWIDDLSYEKALERLASQPTVNIQGLVAGYTGPGGKTVLPARGEAKIDLRLVPDMTFDEAVAKLKAHLKKKGFSDIEVNVSGGYDPNETDENSGLIQAQIATYKSLGYMPTLVPRRAGSWPGVVFTGAPLKLPAGHFGMGYGTGAHAPDEYMVIESANQAIYGMDDAALAYVRFFYEAARSA
ncbi:MAG: M20/M25/M40 family metallo-hydrolase [Alphaproteobacteria bacterium]